MLRAQPMIALMNMGRLPRRSRGFSLVEMMVALVAGLIVIGAVLAFTVSMAQSTGLNIGSTRLHQELRTAANLITREIRRIGYDRKNYNAIDSGVFSSPYAGITIGTSVSSGDCLVTSYDIFNVNDSATSPGATEYKGFRRATASGVGKVQINLADNPPVCNSNSSNWLDLTNSATINVTSVKFFYPAYDTTNLMPFECDSASAGSATSLPSDYQVTAGTNASNNEAINVSVRPVCVVLTGNLVANTAVVRNMVEQVRVRSDVVSNP